MFSASPRSRYQLQGKSTIEASEPMSNLSVFEFNDRQLRVVMIDGEPWFVAKDVCEMIGVANVSDACTKLDDDEKDIDSIDTPGGKQDMAIVSEPGLYSLTLGSRKPQAKPFKRWVTHEVLPTIRKTGGYGKAVTGEPVWYKRLKLYRQRTKIPVGYFSIFEEILGFVGDLEARGYVIADSMVPDISVGQCFCHYMRKESGIDFATFGVKCFDDLLKSYKHWYPDGRVIDANIYSDCLLPLFRQWFELTYKPVKAISYFKKRDITALPTLSQLLGLPEAN